MEMVAVRTLVVRGSVTGSAAATRTTIQVGDARTKVRLRRVKLLRTGGAAANWKPFISRSSTGTATDTNVVWAQGALAAVGTMVDATPTEACEQADSSGAVYLCFDWDAGVNNAATYVAIFEILG